MRHGHFALVGLSGLKPSTTYHYRSVQGRGRANAAVSTDYTFKTFRVRHHPSTISSLRTAELDGLGRHHRLGDDEQSTSQVEYGTTTSYGSATALNPNKTTSHSVGITGLRPTRSIITGSIPRILGNVALGDSPSGPPPGGHHASAITGVSSSALTGNRRHDLLDHERARRFLIEYRPIPPMAVPLPRFGQGHCAFKEV